MSYGVDSTGSDNGVSGIGGCDDSHDSDDFSRSDFDNAVRANDDVDGDIYGGDSYNESDSENNSSIHNFWSRPYEQNKVKLPSQEELSSLSSLFEEKIDSNSEENYWSRSFSQRNITIISEEEHEKLSRDLSGLNFNRGGYYWSRENPYLGCDYALGNLNRDSRCRFVMEVHRITGSHFHEFGGN